MSDNNELGQSVRSRANSEDEMGKDAQDRCRGEIHESPGKLVFGTRNSSDFLSAPIFLDCSKTSAEKRARNAEKQRQHRARNPEKHRAKVRAWAAANPEKKRARDTRARLVRQERERPARLAARAERHEAACEREKARKRAEYQARSDVEREANRKASKAWRAANPGRMRTLVRAWKVANRDKVKAYEKGRGKSTPRRRAYLMKLQRGKCAYCRERLDDTCHIDHVIPRAAGGSNRRSNLQLTCAPCNLSKGARDPIAFAQTMGRLL